MRKGVIENICSIIFIAFLLSSCSSTPKACTIQSLEAQFNPEYFQKHTVVIDGNEKTEQVTVLKDMLLLDEWEEIKSPPINEKATATIHLAEEYEIKIYESYAEVYYGYAKIGERDKASYLLPTGVAERFEVKSAL